MKWAFITTASKSVPDTTYLELHRKRIAQLGWDAEELDLDGKTPDQLRAILKNKDAINMLGGNSFYLIKSIRASGFTKVLQEFLDRGGVYCGTSAGSYVACATIEQATWKKPQKFDHHGVVDFTAMNLVPFLIAAHVTPEIEEMLKPAMEKTKYQTFLLSDEQALLVEGVKITPLQDSSLLGEEYGG